jgi:hypothetical protein
MKWRTKIARHPASRTGTIPGASLKDNNPIEVAVLYFGEALLFTTDANRLWGQERQE